MLRKVHSLPGLIFAVMLAVTATTGAILALDAAVDAAAAPPAANGAITLADLSDRLAARYPELEKITRTPSGKVRVTYLEEGAAKAVFVDPATGEATGEATASPALRTITNLHRAWLSGDGGRAAAGLSALVMLVLAVTGLVLIRRQAGGWLRLLGPLSGTGLRRWHLEAGRLAAAGLILSSVTGLYLSLAGFDLIPDGSAQHETLVSASGGERRPLATLDGLATLTLADLRELTLPYPADATDPITIRTDRAVRHVDAATGAVIAEEPHGLARQAHDLVLALHTAKGMAGLALLLAVSSALGTVLSLTGLVIWLAKRTAPATVSGNVPAATAEIVLLVGSEGGTTWGFARTLHRALTGAGASVHLAAMNDLPAATPQARRLIILTATAGEGDAPASATRFADRLARWTPPSGLEAVVLGFGDRQFATFCGHAHAVAAALSARAIPLALPTGEIDRQSVEAFAAWGDQLGQVLGCPLALDHQPALPATHRFRLVEREDYGHEVQAPTAVLRFAIGGPRLLPAPVSRLLNLVPRFAAGDLVAITPPGETRARFYSIASSDDSGVLEICVRKVPGGACSTVLNALQPGDGLDAAIRPNPAFRPDASTRPLILIGAGAGIAPLVGFIRAAGGRRPVHLYWGGRSPASDFLYRQELELHQIDGRLAGWRTAFSRLPGGGYVQHLIGQDAACLRALMVAGAQVLVCGGREMADGVSAALAEALAPLGLTLAGLRAEGRLIEDVY